MKRNLLALLLTVLAFPITAAKCDPQKTWERGLVFDRFLVIVLENTDYSEAVADPYLKSLAKKGALFSNFHGNFHPSYANYLAMVGGDYFGTFLDVQATIDRATIADLLEPRGLTWKNYAEGYPGNCFLGDTHARYARKHVPFLSFKNIQDDPERCANVVPAQQFVRDFADGTVPNYAFYSPNMDNDGHDTDLPTASAWLKELLEPLLANPEFMERTVIQITFDESKSYFHNHIYTLFLGGPVKQGFLENRWTDHYDVLRTVEENFQLLTLNGQDEKAHAIQTIWKDPTLLSPSRTRGRE
jgi:hypothetical protein